MEEVLAHRLGLVPLNIDPHLVQMKESMVSPHIMSSQRPNQHLPKGPLDQATDRNTIVFNLKVECTRNPAAPKGSTDPLQLFINSEVLSGHLEWRPAGEQEEIFANNPPAPLNKNIVLTKLRPGQAVEMELHAVKGVGKDHAKFSPVGPFSLPLVVLERIC